MLMAALPCVTMLLLMFAPQTGTGNLIVFMGLTALAFFPVPLVPWRRISASWPIMLFPLLALASASWSIDPTTSIRLAIELSITMLAGIIIGSSERRSTIILSTAIGLAIYFMIAMGLGRSVGWGADGDTAFAGLADSKNYFGDMCALVFVASVSIFLLAMMKALRVRIVVMIVCVLLWPLTIGGVLASHSSGALLGIGVAVLVAGTAAVYTWISGSGRIVMMAVLLVTGAIVGGLSISQSNVLNDLVLRIFKKDSTLTGRAYLWYRGDQIIKKQPALGLGYGAFWVQGNADAEGLWRYNHIDDRGGFNFHNTVRDLRVSMGLLGLTLFLLIVLAGIGALWSPFCMHLCPTTSSGSALLRIRRRGSASKA